MTALQMLACFGISPHRPADKLFISQFQCASEMIDKLFGRGGRQAARAQLACNGLVPSLPPPGEQAAQQVPQAELQLSPSAAALQDDLAAFLPEVSLDDLMQSALMLRLSAAVQLIENTPKEQHAALFPQALTDCQLLLNRYAASGGSLLVARHAMQLTNHGLSLRRNDALEGALMRLIQLLRQATERAEADRRE